MNGGIRFQKQQIHLSPTMLDVGLTDSVRERQFSLPERIYCRLYIIRKNIKIHPLLFEIRLFLKKDIGIQPMIFIYLFYGS